MICMIEGKRMSNQYFIKLVVIGSRAHVVENKFKGIIIFPTSSWVVDSNMSRMVDSGESHADCPLV